MGRSDGKLVKDIPAIDRIIPHIMNRRCDATNFAKAEFDMENLQILLRRLRLEGHKIGVMDATITAFALLLQKTPELNRFIVNKKIYQRNHICVSFVVLKREEDGQMNETVVKVFIEQGDSLISISQKIREAIKENEKPQTKNGLDKLVDKLASFPLIPGFAVGTLKWMDRRGILPKSVIRLSPFHTSMFVSNLASIQMNYVYHHTYEFGTTGLFVTLGMPRRLPGEDKTRRVITLGITMDERICKGAVWVKALYEFRRIMENPERLLGEVQETKEAIGAK